MPNEQTEKVVLPLTTIKEVKPNTFIYEKQHALPDALCDDIIARF